MAILHITQPSGKVFFTDISAEVSISTYGILRHEAVWHHGSSNIQNVNTHRKDSAHNVHNILIARIQILNVHGLASSTCINRTLP